MRPEPDAEPTAATRDGESASAGGLPDSEAFAALPEKYRRVIDTGFDHVGELDPAVSVVVVMFRTDQRAFESVLQSLESQTEEAFELLVVNNGVDWDVASRLREYDGGTAYAELVRNCGVTLARNLGASLATSDLLLFLDDDAVPETDFVEAHRGVHEDDDRVVAVRGRVVPQTKTFYNRLQRWYDLGDQPVPYLLNIEGNTSIDREAYQTVSGFDERLGGRAGHEGIDLTYRLVRAGYDRDQIIYSPEPVIYHDFATSLRGYVRKRIVSRRYRKRLTERRPELFDFSNTYSPPEGVVYDKSSVDHLVHLALDGIIRVGSRLSEARAHLRERF